MTYRGTYEKTVFHNPDNDYSVVNFKTDDASIPEKARSKHRHSDKLIHFTATGYRLPQSDAVELQLDGEWENTQYGLQLAVEHFREMIPQTKEGIVGYLSSGLIKGIGESTAEAIVDRFGTGALDVLEKQPDRLLEIKGITPAKLVFIRESYSQSRLLTDLMAFLAPFDITAKTAQKIYQKFGNGSLTVIREKPFSLCQISGFGFKKVDIIARKIGCLLNDPLRIRGALFYVLDESQGKEGHLCLPIELLKKRASRLLNKGQTKKQRVEMQEIADELYNTVMEKKLIAKYESVYLPSNYRTEGIVAREVAGILMQPTVKVDITKELQQVKAELKISLSDKQEVAVHMVFDHGLSIITGSPGTGKTTVLQVVLRVYQRLRRNGKFLLTAPTGRASRRMAESTGFSGAKTLHSALGLISSDEEDRYLNSDKPVDADFIVIDEFSMVDMKLASELFTRLRMGTKILMVGDPDQLPSVGAGNVFREFITCGLIPVTKLDRIFRQSKESPIPHNAMLINRNSTKLLYDESDFVFRECDIPKDVPEVIRSIYLEEIQKEGIENVQILSPLKENGDASSEKLNESIRELINPASPDIPEITVKDCTFRVGDRVMQNKNKNGISNGDVGFIRSITEDTIIIDFADTRSVRTVEYSPSGLNIVELAFAMTVHKSMGSEYKTIIMPILPAHLIMLYRNLIYTAVTRAKQRVYLVGFKGTLAMAIHKNKIEQRNTWLGYRISLYYNEFQKQATAKKIA